MTFAELIAELPYGLRGGLNIARLDFVAGRAVLDIVLDVGDPGAIDLGGRHEVRALELTVDGVEHCALYAPLGVRPSDARGYFDGHEGIADAARNTTPAPAPGAFAFWIAFGEPTSPGWIQFIARSVSLGAGQRK